MGRARAQQTAGRRRSRSPTRFTFVVSSSNEPTILVVRCINSVGRFGSCRQVCFSHQLRNANANAYSYEHEVSSLKIGVYCLGSPGRLVRVEC